ncbi:hypothetical protein ABZY02_09625 [Streptomyces sp. NPDC006649]|uniref:hypothetical protein n=1 Tax=unclassified Streptomyces TaxID=2593676 RepID=UPI00324BFCF5
MTVNVTVNRARHALLTAVSWTDPADLGLPLALAQSQADRGGAAAVRAPEVRAAATSAAGSKGRAARRRRSAVRG